jgi:hypothetical protein
LGQEGPVQEIPVVVVETLFLTPLHRPVVAVVVAMAIMEVQAVVAVTITLRLAQEIRRLPLLPKEIMEEQILEKDMEPEVVVVAPVPLVEAQEVLHSRLEMVETELHRLSPEPQ